LYDVDMVSADEGWAVGAGGTVLHYANGVWTREELNLTATPDLHGVHMVLNAEGQVVGGWAVGDLTGSLPNRPLILRYNTIGGNWQVDTISEPLPANLNSVFALNSDDAGWAVGDKLDERSVFLKLVGSQWQTDTFRPEVNADFYSVWLTAADEGWAVGEDGWYGYYKSQSGSNSFTTRQVGTYTWHDIHVIPTDGGNLGWAVGDGLSLAYISPTSPPCAGGTPCLVQSEIGQANNPDLYGVRLTSPSDGWTVGESGQLLRFQGGTTWIDASQLNPDTQHRTLYAIDMVSTGEGWAVGADGILLHYGTSGGQYASTATLSANTTQQNSAKPSPGGLADWLHAAMNQIAGARLD
jgi:hypothetical protein